MGFSVLPFDLGGEEEAVEVEVEVFDWSMLLNCTPLGLSSAPFAPLTALGSADCASLDDDAKLSLT